MTTTTANVKITPINSQIQENANKLWKLLNNNEGNKEAAEAEGGYAQGYYEGVHDAIIDAMNAFSVQHNEEYYN